MDVSLERPVGIGQWINVYRLYKKAFPLAEQKPFGVIIKMARKGKSDVWCVMAEGKFAGFATTINSPDMVLLDYLAVSKVRQGMGIGHAALKAIGDRYPQRGLFVEIESAFEPGEDQRERQRRRQFYLTCGMRPMGVMAMVFGVKMELLGRNCRLDFAGYQTFYRDNYSPWAAEHLQQMPYPDSGWE